MFILNMYCKTSNQNVMYVLLRLVLYFYLAVDDKNVTVVSESHIHMTFLTGCSRNKILKWRRAVASYHVYHELLTV